MSNRPSPQLKEFARHLLAHEAAVGKSTGCNEEAAFRICDKLRVSLVKPMGAGGFHALFLRAVTLASADVPWLRELRIQPDGTSENLAQLKSKLNDEQLASAEVALLAELLNLLVTFIGAALTLQLIGDVWPKADFSELDI